MSSRFIRFDGSTVRDIQQTDTVVEIFFDPAVVVRSIPGTNDSLWKQEAVLRLYSAQMPDTAEVLSGQMLTGGNYLGGRFSYADMAPAPTERLSPGRLSLVVGGSEYEFQSEQIETELLGMATYLGHED